MRNYSGINRCKCGGSLTVVKFPSFEYLCYGWHGTDNLDILHRSDKPIAIVICNDFCPHFRQFPIGHELYEFDGTDIINRGTSIPVIKRNG